MSTHHLCRCEEIGIEEIRRAIEAGARTVNDVKRQTRAGMGVCQGIYCAAEIARALAVATGASPEAAGPLTARPPVRPVPVAFLAASAPDEPPVVR
jgi:NAD(P)H-nitrite reductase large subunit